LSFEPFGAPRKTAGNPIVRPPTAATVDDFRKSRRAVSGVEEVDGGEAFMAMSI
jgi:hypothetical protein